MAFHFVLSTKGIGATEVKVLMIAFLLFVQSLIGGFLVLISTGNEPSVTECLTVFLTASGILTTFMLTFLRTGKLPETKEKEDEKK